MDAKDRSSGRSSRGLNTEQLLQTIFTLIKAETAEAKRLVVQHPELLSNEADALLRQLVTEEADQPTIEKIKRYQKLLRRCRTEGVEVPFAPKLQPSITVEPILEIPAGFEEDVQELGKLAKRARRYPELNLQRIALIEGMLLHLPRVQAPAFRGALLNDLGNAYFAMPTGDRAKNLNQAITCYREALRFRTSEAAPLDYATTQNNLGNAYFAMPTGDRTKNLEQAIACYREALRFWTSKTNPSSYALVQNNLGAAYFAMPTGDRTENLEQAIACYREALRFWTSKTNPSSYALVQNNLGTVYRNLPTGDRAKNLEQAIACYREALRFRTPEAAPLDYATTQNNLGNAYADLPAGDRTENLKQAIAAYKEALRFRTPETGPLDYAATQNNLGNAYLTIPTGDRAKNLEQAITCYREALRFRTPEAIPWDYATTQNNLGNAYFTLPSGDRAKNMKQAIAAYKEALRFWTPEAAPMDCAMAQNNLGNLYFGEGQWEQAYSAYDLAIAANEMLYHATATEVARQAVLAEAGSLYAKDAYCQVRLGRFTGAVERLEAGRARALSEALARDRVVLEKADPSDRAAFEATRDRIKALEVKARTLGAVGFSDDGERQFVELSSNLRTERQELDALVRRIRDYLPEFMPTGLDFKTIASTSAPDSPVVYLITTTQGSLGLIVPYGVEYLEEKHSVWMDTFRGDELNSLLVQQDSNGNATGGYLVGQVAGDLALLQSELDRALPTLQERLVGPLAARLVELGYQRAVLIPGGCLSLLPLPAVALETITITFAPSARALKAARQTAVGRAGLSPVLLGVGNPLPNPQPLDFARAEVEAIATFFPNDAQRLLPEHQATRVRTLENIPDATYMHFSCHGSFDVEEPLDSALLLSGDDTLKLRDLLEGDLDLSKSRLAVLSACQTGITDFRRVPDEAVGLPAGFLQAGVPGVVSTLWPVNDLSTALLLARFYRYHLQRGMDPAAALCRAQRWLRNATAHQLDLANLYERQYRESGRRDPVAFQAMRHYRKNPESRPFEHPFYWAGFTFTGAG